MILWFTISIIFVVVAMILFFVDECESTFGKVLSIIFSVPVGTSIGLIIGFVLNFVVGLTSFLIPLKANTVSEYNIYSVKDNITSNGSFILGSGTTKNNIKIFYVKETPKGKIIEQQIMSNIIIVESDDIKPNVRVDGKRLPKWVAHWILPDLNFMTDKTILTVPADTIIKNYNIDLQ